MVKSLHFKLVGHTFEENLKDELYKVWNRMCSGSYFPPSVLGIDIPKRNGKFRRLGIPTVADRVAQGVIKVLFEHRLEKIFLDDSYGYRPGRSCHDAIAATRLSYRSYGCLLEYDIIGLFDKIPHDLLMKAVRLHFPEKWVCLYIERWLKAAMINPDGTVAARKQGRPQGGVLSPMLSNLFMHYASDLWMKREFQDLPWCRYSDDGLVHCKTKKQAEFVRDRFAKRLAEVGLEIHPEKTRIVQCVDDRRKKVAGKHFTSFTFLGFEFKNRIAQNSQTGELFMRFLPAIGNSRLKELKGTLKKQPVLRAMFAKISDVSEALNPIIRGWINYYSRFYPSRLKILFKNINERLAIWLKNKYRRSKRGGTMPRAYAFLRSIFKSNLEWSYQRKYSSDPM